MTYLEEAKDDAARFIGEFEDQIVEQIIYSSEASDDCLNDYANGDSYHHESHVDKEYDLSESAAILDELSEYEETDSGLWEGLAPREAISAQAAYTYGAAVYSKAQELIKAINEAVTKFDLPEGQDEINAEQVKAIIAEQTKAFA